MAESTTTDRETTLHALREVVSQFVNERNWQQFHTPKNISMALAIEAAELMEHFQWLDGEASRAVASDPQQRAAVGEELADVLCYCLALANELGLDLTHTLQAKMVKNRLKYPVEEYRGRFGPEDPRPVSDAE